MSFIPTQQEPILILDINRCKRNIARMTKRTKDANCIFRPHFKTHQSMTVGRWFREADVSGITVSSIRMAKYFIEDGWDDITIAFPFFPQQMNALKDIEQKASIRLFVNSTENLYLLAENLQHPFKFYIEIDTGSGRSGISYQNTELISKLIETANKLPKATFHGFYTHDGRTYQSRSKQEIQERIDPSIDILIDLKTKFPGSKISMGDTPSSSSSDRLDEFDEMTPGNFVFYDYMQVQIGSCTLDDVALFAVLPIAQVIPNENRTIVHGGAVHLSKESLPINHSKNFGQLIHYSADSTIAETNHYISSISQEHGTIQGIPDSHEQIWVCPIHSCLTANLHSKYYTKDGDTIGKRILS